MDTASSMPPTMMLQNTMNALSSCSSVLTSLFGLCIFMVYLWFACVIFLDVKCQRLQTSQRYTRSGKLPPLRLFLFILSAIDGEG